MTLSIDGGGNGFTSYQLWYGKQVDIANPANPDFSPFNGMLTQYQHDVPGNSPNVTVTGLEPGTAYYVYVVPQGPHGIPADGNGNPVHCYESVVTTSATGGSCFLPVTKISDTDQQITAAEGDLFDDQQLSSFDECGLSDLTNAPPFLDFMSNGRSMVVELEDYTLIDNFELFFDGTSAGIFTIEGSLVDNPNSYRDITQYYTNALNEWVTVSNFEQSIDGYKYMKFTNPDNLARVNEALVCGRKACLLNDDAPNLSYCIDYDPNPGPWGLGCRKFSFKVRNTVNGSTPYNKIQIWYTPDGPFQPGIHPEASGMNVGSVVKTFYNLPFSSTKLVDVTGLQQNTEYWFAYRMLDSGGRSSQLYFMDRSYHTIRCDGIPNIKEMMLLMEEDCIVKGVWWTDKEEDAGISYYVNEHSESTEYPMVNPIKSTLVQRDEVTKSYSYFIEEGSLTNTNTNTNTSTTGEVKWLYMRGGIAPVKFSDWYGWELEDPKLCGGGDKVDGRSGGRSLNQDRGGKVSFSPNPTSGKAALEFPSGEFTVYEVFSPSGKPLYRKGIAAGQSKILLDFSDFSAGIYFFKLYDEVTSRAESFKFVINR